MGPGPATGDAFARASLGQQQARLSPDAVRARPTQFQTLATQEDANAAKKRKENTKEVVFVMEKGGTVKQIEVKTGISDFENIEILSGLADGQEIISGPYATVAKKLKAGDLVKKKEIKKDEKASEKK